MLRHYILLATKVLRRRPFFTFISLFGIAFTLVVLVVVTAFIDHAIAPAAPESRQDRTLGVSRAVMYGPRAAQSADPGFRLLDQYARGLPGVEYLSIFSTAQTVTSFVDGRKMTLARKRTDAEFWRALEFTFIEGRPYSADEVANAAFVAVVSASTRRQVLGNRPLDAGPIEVDGQRFRVIGVVDDVSAVRFVPYADVWVPLTTSKTTGYREDLMGGFQAIAVARSRDDLAAIHDEFNSRLHRIQLPDGYDALIAPFETKFEYFARLSAIGDRTSEDSQAPRLIALLTVLGLMFSLLPALNLVNINVSRIMERASEIGVRKAFGARSRTLVVQFIVENILLTLAGVAVAFVVSFFVLGALNRSGLVAHLQLVLNVRVFLWGAALAVLFGILSGVYPAWRMSRLHPVDALKGVAR